jgi:hypothetical protein
MNEAVRLPESIPWERIRQRALVTGLCGLVLCLFAAVISPSHALRAYLVAFNYWLGIALGCLVLLMLQHLTGGIWGLVLRRIFESGARTLGLLALLFLPLLLGLLPLPILPLRSQPNSYWWDFLLQPPLLYDWAGSSDPKVLEKSWYLNVPFFLGRAAGYFIIWIVIAFFLYAWSVAQDRGSFDDRRFRLLSGPGLVLYGGTITFASVDWVMSLEPHWNSTIYPVIFAVGQILQAMAFSIIVLIAISSGERGQLWPRYRDADTARTPSAFEKLLGPTRRRDLGNLLLAFVMLWAYTSFSQFLLIWSANLTEEIPWYLRRTRGGWQWLAWLLVAFQFSLPFLLLLSRDIKENPRRLAAVALLILVMRYLDIFWWIEPAFSDGVYFYFLVDLAAVVGLGGIWIWHFLNQLDKLPLLPLHEPALTEGLAHE